MYSTSFSIFNTIFIYALILHQPNGIHCWSTTVNVLKSIFEFRLFVFEGAMFGNYVVRLVKLDAGVLKSFSGLW